MSWTASEIAVGAGAGSGAEWIGGLPVGTEVLTADGALPVEFVEPGDRLIMRAGTGIVRDVTARRYSGPAIRLRAGALDLDRRGRDLVLPAATPILLRDWRAWAMFGVPEVVVPIRRVADGAFIAPDKVLSMRLFELRFEMAEAVHAEGLEIVCEAAGATATADG